MVASDHGTPMENAMGENSHPNTRDNDKGSPLMIIQPIIQSTMAMRPTKATNMAATFNANFIPSDAPRAAASSTF